MPAHYSLLHYTKGQNIKFNINDNFTMIDASDYCLRASCIKKRKENNDDRKVFVNDIWTDISRIKHKKDRDDHPCQLPEKLMERIINLFSNEGDFVFDPFSGAGTTPIVAKRLNRKYAAIDISEDYVNIAKNKINQLELNGSIEKSVIKKKARKVTKKRIEIYIQDLCSDIGRPLTESEFIKIVSNDEMLEFNIDDIIKLYGDLKTALKCSRIILKEIKDRKNKTG